MEIKVTGCTMDTGSCPFLDSEYDQCNITKNYLWPSKNKLPIDCPLLTENIYIVKET